MRLTYLELSLTGKKRKELRRQQRRLEELGPLTTARVTAPDEVATWVREEPTGRYARRTAFLYEWFTGQRLNVPDTAANVGYVDAIDHGLYLTAQRAQRVRRWRINDNLPGPSDCCPLVYLGPEAERAWLYDVAAGVKMLDDTYGPELLLRSAAWLTFKESRASFAIEREAEEFRATFEKTRAEIAKAVAGRRPPNQPSADSKFVLLKLLR